MSKKPNDSGRFQLAQQMRQAILDYLGEHPGSGIEAITDHISTMRGRITKQWIGDYLKRMTLLEEVAREPRGARNSRGHCCGGYYRLKETTTRWQDMHLLTKHVNEPEPNRPKTGPNGGRVHYSGDIPEITRYPSGGQGSLVRAAIGSGMYGDAKW